MKKLKLLILFFLLGLFLYSKFYYYDPSFGCNIVIIPAFLPSNNDTKQILKMIKSGAPDDYMRICKYVSIINKNPSCGGFDGGCFQPSKPRTIYIGNDQSNIAMSGALVIHEMCHAIQAAERRSMSERECYTAGNSYLNTVTKY